MFHKTKLISVYTIKELSRVRDVLDSGGIKYTIKTSDRGSSFSALFAVFQVSSARSKGSFQSNSDYEKQYVVYVMKEDLDQSKYLLHL